MYVESLKSAMAAFGPIFVQLYGQGEAPDDHHRIAGRITSGPTMTSVWCGLPRSG